MTPNPTFHAASASLPSTKPASGDRRAPTTGAPADRPPTETLEPKWESAIGQATD
jgi:hypothetical protein